MPAKIQAAEHRFIGALLLSGGLLAAVAVSTLISQSAAREANNWRDHTHQVATGLESLQSLLFDAESGTRGYLFTGQDVYLAPYDRHLSAISERLAELHRLTADNPTQQKRLDELQPLVDRKLAAMDSAIALHRQGDFAEVKRLATAGAGRQLMDQIRNVVAAMRAEEHRLLLLRDEQASGDETRATLLVIAGTAIALVLVGVTAYLMMRAGAALRVALLTTRDQEWLQTSVAGLGDALRETQDAATLAKRALDRIAPLLAAPVGALYRRADQDGGLVFAAGFALDQPRRPQVAMGEGLIGEAASSRRMIEVDDIPADYLPVASALGSTRPRRLAVVPLHHHGEIEGVIELGVLRPWTPIQRAFLLRAAESVAIALASARAVARVTDLLGKSQQQEEELRVQQEELTQSNEELEEQARLLTERNREIEHTRQRVEAAHLDLEAKARQLAQISSYKSEFLSNMSHELRTPLNSLLILSQLLSDNANGNLDEKQVRYARTIHSSGHDLLTLINDILDLAKIESGTVTAEIDDVDFEELREAIEGTMRPLAEQKGLEFAIHINDRLPQSLRSDGKRLLQVLKNLLANAFKFTPVEAGRPALVSLSIDLVPPEAVPARLARSGAVVGFAVSDTGIGIPGDKQQLIFEAFRQADGSVSRRYGGTGLGLSICRELANLLGGELTLVSAPGVGSTFTLHLPLIRVEAPATPGGGPGEEHPFADSPPAPGAALARTAAGEAPLSVVDDDRADLRSTRRLALVVSSDAALSRTLVELAHAHAFQAVVSLRGAGVPGLARDLHPDAIILDVQLSDGDGWQLLDRLKRDPATRHIPVHVIAVGDERMHALSHGAHGVMAKPVDRAALDRAFAGLVGFHERIPRRLLMVEDNPVESAAMVAAIASDDVTPIVVADGEAALAALRASTAADGLRIDCIVLDLGLPGMGGRRLLDTIAADPHWRDIPVIIYTARDLTAQDEQELRRSAKTIVLKTAGSLDRLLDETTLFLHRVHTDLPETKRLRIERIRAGDVVLTGRTVLVVDDDVRNIFALTSLLERCGMVVIGAENGHEALARLRSTPEIAVVLMDLMMPGMDGYAAIRAIRATPAWRDLPVIALTAKAMTGDRDRCLEAGASDYIAKPLDSDQLLSILRVWLYG